ncbi:MAG TPA: DUF1192 domain-containing protein [Alphaproteobacteria bacterium]|jgi:uncharacterized small protein (DUF1192 family)
MAMEDEDLQPRTKKPAPKNLDPMSIGELESYIGELEGEILRARAEIERKRKVRGGAEALFRK